MEIKSYTATDIDNLIELRDKVIKNWTYIGGNYVDNKEALLKNLHVEGPMVAQSCNLVAYDNEELLGYVTTTCDLVSFIKTSPGQAAGYYPVATNFEVFSKLMDHTIDNMRTKKIDEINIAIGSDYSFFEQFSKKYRPELVERIVNEYDVTSLDGNSKDILGLRAFDKEKDLHNLNKKLAQINSIPEDQMMNLLEKRLQEEFEINLVYYDNDNLMGWFAIAKKNQRSRFLSEVSVDKLEEIWKYIRQKISIPKFRVRQGDTKVDEILYDKQKLYCEYGFYKVKVSE